MGKALLACLLAGLLVSPTQAQAVDCPTGYAFSHNGVWGDCDYSVQCPTGYVRQLTGEGSIGACESVCTNDQDCAAFNYRFDNLRCYSYSVVGTKFYIDNTIACLKATPTPTPTIATAIVASGDPIAIINGYRIKFDIPSGKDHLLWKTPESELMARADLITPDKSSQWFSDFIFLCHGQRLLHIERKEIVSDADATVNTLSTLMLRLTTTDGVERVTTPGEYKVSKEGVMVIVKHDTSKIGDTPRDIVTVSSMDITFDVVPQLAKKFTDLNMAMKYVHLDINMRKMRSNVIGGMFAEMWGFVPMSKHTAQLIRKVKRMQ